MEKLKTKRKKIIKKNLAKIGMGRISGRRRNKKGKDGRSDGRTN